MKKIIPLVVLLIVFSLISTASAQELIEDDLEIETSIVLLTLYDSKQDRIFKQDDFFEIFYFSDQDYFLLPANLISPYLEVDLNFNRDLLLLTLAKNSKEVKVDLKTKQYLGHPEWNDKAAVIFGGEFYLCKELFSYLTNYQISWNNSLQEVVVEGEFIEDIDIETGLSEDVEEKSEEIKEDVLGDELKNFQMSSIHYRIQLDLEETIFNTTNKELKGDLNFYGRSGDWAYYLNNDFEYNIDDSQINYELEKIKFKYQENNILIIAGNHDFYLEETLGRNEMQGLYFSFPDQLSYKLIPYTDLNFEVEAGDQIIIYVNDNIIKRESIKVDHNYKFENIELRAGYLNKIEVVKINSDGEETKKTSYLAGANDILTPKIKENEIFIGRYRDDDSSEDDWTGYLGAWRSNYAVNKNLSLNLETAVYNESLSNYNNFEGEVISSITGFALRAAPNIVINLDWMVGGPTNNLESGAQAKLLYSMLKGYIQGLYIYLPPGAADYMEKEEGEEKSLSLRLDLNDNLSINPIMGQEKTLENRIDTTDYYTFRVIYNPSWRNYNVFSLYYEENREEYLFSSEDDQLYLFIGDKIRKGLGLETNIYANTFRISSDLKYYDNDLNISNFYTDNYQDYEADIGLYKRFNDYLLLSLNYDGEQQRDSGGSRYYDREYDGEIRLAFANRASLSLESSRKKEESESRIDEELKLRLNYYFNREFSLKAELKDYHSDFLNDYQSFEISGNYYYSDNPGYIRLTGEYIIPDQGDPGINFSAEYDIIRDDESEIKLEIGRGFSNFLTNDYNKYITIAYSHAISFIGSEKTNDRFTDFEPRPIVAGYVYLDENYNGVMDSNEKKLENIPMRLGNMLNVSDEDGFFIFKPYFNDLYLLNFDYRNLIADYTPVTEEILIRVKDNQNIMQNFGLTINGTVSGRVFIDKNANGVKDDNDEYLMWAGLELEGLNKKDYTNQLGEYYFQNIPLGYHKLTILKESLPKGTKVFNSYTQDVFITEDNLDHHNIDIAVVYGD